MPLTPQDWPAARIKALRLFLGESTTKFGARFGRSRRTVEDWEQDRRHPEVLARAALDQIARRRRWTG